MSDIRKDKIQLGDRVCIYWDHINSIEGKVVYIPCATGDSWTIVSDDGTIHEVQMFGRMTRINKIGESNK